MTMHVRQTRPASAVRTHEMMPVAGSDLAQAIDRCAALLQDHRSNRLGRANIEVFLGGLIAQRGDFDEAEALIAGARATFEELGHRSSVATSSAAIPHPSRGIPVRRCPSKQM